MAIQTNIYYQYADILTLRPDLTNLVKSVPKPKGAIIKNGLPSWNIRPLDTKLPLLSGPEGPFVFSRGKLGTSLWRKSKQTEFILSDPYGYEFSFNYEPIHDKHLRKWFKNTKNRENILKLGLVTEEMDVKCSVKQYNEYRKYLQKLHSIAVCKETIRQENNALEKMVHKNAAEALRKEINKLNRKAKQAGRRQEYFEMLNAEAESKKQNCERRLKRIVDRNAYMEQKKKDNLKESIERTKAKNEFIQNRIIAAEKLERKRKIQTLRRWHEIDLEKKKKKEAEELQRQADLAQKARERWERKVENQKMQIKKEEFLQNLRKLELSNLKEIRMKKTLAKFACFQERLLLQQSHPIVSGAKKEFKKKQQVLLNTVQDTFLKKISGKYSEDPETLKSLKKKIQQTLADIRFDLEPYVLVSEANRRLHTCLEVPEPVLDVIKYLTEQAIAVSVAKKLEDTMYKITHRILFVVDRLQPSDTGRKSSNLIRKGSKSSGQNIPKVLKEKQHVRVSFGALELVEMEENLDIKSVKNRHPTPVVKADVNLFVCPQPSVSSIIKVALEDQDIEYEYTSSQIFGEQKKLLAEIDQICGWLLKHIEKRVQEIAESFPAKCSSSSDLPCKNYHPLVRLCNLVLFGTEDDFMSILDRIIYDVLKEIDFSYQDVILKRNKKVKK